MVGDVGAEKSPARAAGRPEPASLARRLGRAGRRVALTASDQVLVLGECSVDPGQDAAMGPFLFSP